MKLLLKLLLAISIILPNSLCLANFPAEKIKLNLNSDWQFRQVGEGVWYDAKVPGEVHTDLLDNGIIEDPFFRDNERKLQWIGKTDWEYQVSFTLRDDLYARENAEIVFKGLDTYASVFLNDSLILEATNMFREWRIACKSLLKSGQNILRIVFRSPINEILPHMDTLSYRLPAVNDRGEKTSPHTRKAPYHFGWDWGPRFVTCGIWQPVYLEFWNYAKIVDLHLEQKKLNSDSAAVISHIEIFSKRNQHIAIELTSVEKKFNLIEKYIYVVAGINKIQIRFSIKNPELWWPNGLGDQTLYTIHVKIFIDDIFIDFASKRIGLRSIILNQKPDRWGESFEFIVNGVPLFAKGGNWIPADNFLNRIDKKKYEHLISSVKNVNMNMLRVWGGGIYENDIFYDLCDEMGIMVWQDFMFACSMYPADVEFLENVEEEVRYQVKRLRNHPSIVLWCGNNEVEVAWKSWGWRYRLPSFLWDNYEKIFHELLKKVCLKLDAERMYWPSSPSSFPKSYTNSQRYGDVHYWGVWHSGESFSAFTEQKPRFLSEYGFQSFPEARTINKFTLPQDRDIETVVMKNHQKHSRGNKLILEYMLRDYRQPKDFTSFVYLSQVLQAEGIKLGTEHYRRIRPQCMGTLYWQINDCWPGASWSSIDFYGNWKALHYYARQFYAPILISPYEEAGTIKINIISDELETREARINAQLLNFKGEILNEVADSILIRALSSQICWYLDKGDWLNGNASNYSFMVVDLETDHKQIAENIYFFEAPRDLNLLNPIISVEVFEMKGGFKIILNTDCLAMNVYLSTSISNGFFSDNYFHLIPGRKKEIKFHTDENTKVVEFHEDLQIQSLVDAFKS
jgi:beta-mannosidase